MQKRWLSIAIISSYLVGAAEKEEISAQELLKKSLDVQKNSGKELLKEHKLRLKAPMTSQVFRDVGAFAYHPNGVLAAIAYHEFHQVCIRDMKAQRYIAQLQGHDKRISAFAFNVQGTQLASGSSDGTIYLWDSKDWKQSIRLKGDVKDGEDHIILGLCYNPKKDTQLLSSERNDITVWDVEKREQISKKKGCCFAYDTEGTRCAIGNNKRIELYDTTTWEPLRTIDFRGMLSSIIFHPKNGRLAVSFSHDMALEKDDEAFEYIEFPRKGSWPKLAYNAKGSRLIVGDECSIYIYDTSNQERFIDDHANEKRCWIYNENMDVAYLVTYHPDDNQFAIVSNKGEMRVMDIPHYKDVVSSLSLVQALYVARELTIKKRIGEERNEESQKMYDSLPANIQRVIKH